MKRKEVIDTILQACSDTYRLNPTVSLVNAKTKESCELDAPTTLAIVRGTLAWVCELLDRDTEFEQEPVKNLQRLLSYVGAQFATDNLSC